MRILVLGATGFIGGQIARGGHAEGWEVHGLRRQPDAVGAIGDLPVTWHRGDLADRESLMAAMQGCEVVFHAAGYAPGTERSIPRALRQGVDGMRNVLEAARQAGVKRVIYTSSLTTVGPPPAGSARLADERDVYLPGSTRNNYYEVKWAMEHEAQRATLDGLPVVILVPTAVFGPRDVKPSTSEILLLVAQGRFPFRVDIESNVVDGRDVALAHIRAVEKGEPGQRYIIGGHNVNVGEAISQAAEILGVKPPRINLSHQAVARLIGVVNLFRLPLKATMRGLPYWQPMNCELGQRTFGFTPRPFEDTVRDTVGWFRENGYL